MEEDLSVNTIIIVACVCGSVVLILTIILIVLCCRRYRTKQKYQKAEATRPPPPIMTHSNGGGHQEEPLKSALRNNHGNGGSGVENPGMDNTDMIDFDDPSRTGVFATESSHQLPPGYYNDRGNGYIPNGSGPPAQPWKNGIPPPSYDNSLNDELNRRNRDHYSSQGKANKNIPPRDKAYLQLDDPYQQHHHPHNNSKESHKDSDSGVSTPDPQKPKKVIYEVIV